MFCGVGTLFSNGIGEDDELFPKLLLDDDDEAAVDEDEEEDCCAVAPEVFGPFVDGAAPVIRIN